MNETTPEICPQCGKELPSDAPSGLCPSCVMAMNLAAETELTGDAGSVPISSEELAARLPQFEVLEFLGRGGMGVVYKARQTALDREVAIKVLAGDWQKEPSFAQRFEQEAKTLAQMSHPNIVTIHDFGAADGLYYIVMEYVDGVNLRDLLSDGKLQPEQALAIVPPICEALEYAHGKGVVHRDIKPENLLLDRDGGVKIADFGIAALVGQISEIAGTPSYMAPEQANGSVDRRTDIYALGVVLYEMLTGERPTRDVVAPSKKVEVDVKIDEMVLRALEKEPERRYQTAREFCTTAEFVMATPHYEAGERKQSNSSPKSQAGNEARASDMTRAIEILFGVTFTSRWAIHFANLSALGFLGCLGFLGNIPQLASWKSLFGMFGFFGFIGAAILVEIISRIPKERLPSGHDSESGQGKQAVDVLASEHLNFSPWESTIAMTGTIFSALMLFPAMEIPGSVRYIVMFFFGMAFSVGVVSLAGLWPFPSPLFPKPNFSSRNLARSHTHEDSHPNEQHAIYTCLAAVGLSLLAATGNAAVMLVGASIMLLGGLAWASRGGLRQALLIVLAAAFVATVAAWVLSLGDFLRGPPSTNDFYGHWRCEEDATGDNVWLTIPTTGPARMHGTDLGGQLQFHRQFDWMVKEGKFLFKSGMNQVTGELIQEDRVLRIETVKDERNILFQRTMDVTPALETDLIIIEDKALHMIVAIREKNNEKLMSLATDRIEGWSDALPVFAVELRERYRQLVGDEEFDLRPTESLVQSDLGVVRCTGPEVLAGKCLVLSFVKTSDGWKNSLLKNSIENVELREHLSELERQLDTPDQLKLR